MWQRLFQFTKPTTITAAIDAYFRNFNLAPLTRRQYRTGLRRFEEHLLNEETIDPTREKVNAITLLEVRKFVNSLKRYAPSTERVYTYALYGFLDELVANPAIDFDLDMYQVRRHGRRRLRTPAKRIPNFPKQAITQLLEYVATLHPSMDQTEWEQLNLLRSKALVLTLADTGLRIHEACKLLRGDLDRNTRKAVVTGKGNKEAMVRFTPRAVGAIETYLTARQDYDAASGKSWENLPIFSGHDRRGLKQMKPISTNGGRSILAEMVVVALGEESKKLITPHTLRHYFVTQAMIRSGGNLRVAQELARHSSLATTERYAHLDERELDEQFESIFVSGE